MVGPRPFAGAAIPPLVLALLGGILYGISIPKVELAGFAWVCLAPPLAYMLAGRRRGPGIGTLLPLGVGLVYGLVSGYARLYWIAETLENYGGLGPVMAVLTNALLVAYVALYPACFFWLVSRLVPAAPAPPLPGDASGRGVPSAAFPWLAACAWVSLEWLQSWLFTGFPWFLLGYSMYRDLPLIQVASLTGVYGVSFVAVAVNAALAQATSHLWRGGAPSRLWRPLAPVVAVLVAVYAYGSTRLARLEKVEDPEVRVGLVQGNIPQDQKWKADHRTAAATERYVDLTRQLAAAHPDLDLIIFPETALPYYFTDPAFAPYADQVRALAAEVGRPLLVGSLEGRVQSRPSSIYNRAYLLDARGQIAGYADKVHLVPFGEYLPLPWIFKYLEGLTAESGRFSHGDRYRTITLPGRGIPLGVFICYESIFPQIPRALVRLGAQVLVNTTNDAWFGTTAAPRQHLAMAALRAVETGRAVVRAANTGISGAIAPSGAILSATDLFTTTTLAVVVPVRTERTGYTRWGDALPWTCTVFLLLWWMGVRRRAPHRRPRFSN